MKKIDMETWYRKEYYDFFNSFACPCYGKTIHVDVTNAYDYCKKNGYSFFCFSLYVFLRACNLVPQFRHRDINGEVFDMEILTASTPIMKKNDENHQFTIVDIPYKESFSAFLSLAKTMIENVNSGVCPDKKSQETTGLVSLNCSPWFSYSGAKLANLTFNQSIPLLDWGKYEEENGKKIMPYTYQVNHKFIDGYHCGQFVNLIAEYFKNPESI